MRGFFSELAKIAEDAAAANPEAAAPILGIPAAELARTLGEARSYQRAPGLRRAAERAVRYGGALGAGAAVFEGRPGMAALMGGLAQAPDLIRGVESSVRGYGALKGSGTLNDAALAQVRNALISHNVGRLIPAATGMAATQAIFSGAQSGHWNPILPWSPLLAHLATSPMRDQTMKGPDVSMEEAENLRQQMGVEAPLHKGVMGHGRYVAPESTGALLPGLRETLTSWKLRSGSRPEARGLLEEGGVIVPTKKRKA